MGRFHTARTAGRGGEYEARQAQLRNYSVSDLRPFGDPYGSTRIQYPDTDTDTGRGDRYITGAVWNGTAASSFAGGTGTQANPYLISTGEQLAYLRNLVNAGNTAYNSNTKYYALTNDIYLNDTTNWENWDTAAPANTWTPIGIYVYPDPAGITFKANFDGRGHAVKGMYTSMPSGQYTTGLFEYAEGARISNLGIEKGHITARPTVAEDNVGIGSLVGYLYGGGVVENCWNTAKITASGSCGSYYLCVGGLVGIAYIATIINCYNAGDINAQPSYNFGIAGLVGSFFGTNSVYTYAANSYNVGNIKIAASSGYQHIGGITNDLGVTYNCYNAGRIEISGGYTIRYLGGIAGVRSNGSANHSYFLNGTASYATYNNTAAANCSSFSTSGNLTTGISINGTTQTTLLGALNSFANKTAYISGYAPANTPLKK